MCDDLMPKEVKVDPPRGTAALLTSQNTAIKTACRIEIVDRKREVKEVVHDAAALLMVFLAICLMAPR
jgi:hypothetical protein